MTSLTGWIVVMSPRIRKTEADSTFYFHHTYPQKTAVYGVWQTVPGKILGCKYRGASHQPTSSNQPYPGKKRLPGRMCKRVKEHPHLGWWEELANKSEKNRKSLKTSKDFSRSGGSSCQVSEKPAIAQPLLTFAKLSLWSGRALELQCISQEIGDEEVYALMQNISRRESLAFKGAVQQQNNNTKYMLGLFHSKH